MTWTHTLRKHLYEQAVSVVGIQDLIDTLNKRCTEVSSKIADDTVAKNADKHKDSVLGPDERKEIVQGVHSKEKVTFTDRQDYFAIARGGRTRFLVDKHDGKIYAVQTNALPNTEYDYGDVKSPKLKEMTIALVGSWHGDMVEATQDQKYGALGRLIRLYGPDHLSVLKQLTDKGVTADDILRYTDNQLTARIPVRESNESTPSINVYNKERDKVAVNPKAVGDDDDDADDVKESFKGFAVFVAEQANIHYKEETDKKDPEICSICRKEPVSEKYYPYCSQACASEAAEDSKEDDAYERDRDDED